MLALRRIRCLLHSIPASQTRQLRTQPRPIPRYTRQWNPTLHSPFSPSRAPNKPLEPTTPPQSIIEQGSPEDTNEVLLPTTDEQPSSKEIVIRLGNRRSQELHEIKKLEYLLN